MVFLEDFSQNLLDGVVKEAEAEVVWREVLGVREEKCLEGASYVDMHAGDRSR